MRTLKRRILVMLLAAMIAFCAYATKPNVSRADGDTLLLHSDSNFSITVTDYDFDELFGLQLSLQIKNTSGKALLFSASLGTINSLMVEPFLYGTVEAGKTMEEKLRYSSKGTQYSGCNVIKECTFYLTVSDPKNPQEPLFFDWLGVEFTDNSGEPAIVPFEFTCNEVELINTSDFYVSFLDAYEAASGLDMVLYIKNRTKNAVRVELSNISINGVASTPFFVHEILPGYSLCDAASWFDSFLTENKITSIKEIGFTIEIYLYDDYGTTPLLSKECGVVFS